MRKPYANLLILLVIACLLLPFAAVRPPQADTPSAPDLPEESGKIRVYLSQSGKTVKLSRREYLTGVLFAETSPDFQEEAIKAQAVAAYTLLLYRMQTAGEDAAYDLTDDPQTGQGYLTPEAAKEKYGAQYAALKQQYEGLLDAVDGDVITYDGAPICAMYHAVSGGKTESAENVFGGSLPYLVPVESVGDLLCPDYFSTAEFSVEEVKSRLTADGTTLPEDANPVAGEARSDSGTVLKIELFGRAMTGAKVRDMFSLNAANFDLEVGEETVVFRVRGKGHGVGMSQYGANYMASLGSTFQEILSWYYPGCEIQEKK